MGRRSLRRQLPQQIIRAGFGTLWLQRRKRARQIAPGLGDARQREDALLEAFRRAPGNIGSRRGRQCLGEKLDSAGTGVPDSVTASISAAKYCAARRFA